MEFRYLLVPHRIDGPLPYLVRDHRDRGAGIYFFVVEVRAAVDSAARPSDAWIAVRDHEVVARRDGPRRGAHREAARVVLLVRRHPCVKRLEVAQAQFVAERGRDHRRVVAVCVGYGLQFAAQPAVERGVVPSRETGFHALFVPVPQFAEHHHAEFVGGLERGGGRSPGVQLDGVHPVVAFDVEYAQPLAFRHVGMPGEGKCAVVHVGADEQRASVDRQAVAFARDGSEAEAHRLGEAALRVAELHLVEAWIEFVPCLRLFRERRRHHHAPLRVRRRPGRERCEAKCVRDDASGVGLEAFRQFESHFASGGEVREHADGIERIRFAQFDLANRAVPDGLHPFSESVRLFNHAVLRTVVDGDFEHVLSRRKRAGRDFVDVRSSQRIAESEIASVDLHAAGPHHALKKQFQRLCRFCGRERDRARICRFAGVPVPAGESCLFRAFGISGEFLRRLQRAEFCVRKRSGQPRCARETVAGAPPFAGKVDAHLSAVRREGECTHGSGRGNCQSRSCFHSDFLLLLDEPPMAATAIISSFRFFWQISRTASNPSGGRVFLRAAAVRRKSSQSGNLLLCSAAGCDILSLVFRLARVVKLADTHA